jgi:hypothetical protein
VGVRDSFWIAPRMTGYTEGIDFVAKEITVSCPCSITPSFNPRRVYLEAAMVCGSPVR